MTVLSQKELERGRELYNDPIFREIMDKLQDEVLDFHCNALPKYVDQLKKHGLSEIESCQRVMGSVLAQSMQGLYETFPAGYPKDKLMQAVSEIYDMIHMQVRDEEVLGDKKPS